MDTTVPTTRVAMTWAESHGCSRPPHVRPRMTTVMPARARKMPRKSTALSFLDASICQRPFDFACYNDSQLPVSLYPLERHEEDDAERRQKRQWQVQTKDPAPRVSRLGREGTA